MNVVAGLGQVGSQPGDRQDAPAGDLDAIRAGMEEQGVGGFVAEVDDRPGLHGGGIAGRRGHDGAGRTLGVDASIAQLAVAAGECERCQVVGEQRQHGLRLRIAEAAVVLQQLGAVGCQHEARVEHTDVGRTFVHQEVDDRLDEHGGEVIGVVRNRRGSVGAHAAGVGAGVAFADALVILRHRERTSDCAVAQRHQAALWATEPLLEHDRPLCHQFANGGFGRGVEIWAFGHDDALAGCQAVELDDHWLAELAPPGDGLLGIG